MELMLEIISRQKFSLQQSDVQHVFREVGGYIGRDKQCEWVLLDKTKQISRKHALISFEQSAFFIEDLSTNGIFNALGKERLGKGKKYRVEHGNTYVIGEYSIQARLLHEPESCLSEQSIESGEIIPAGDFLADDPLLALEQQDELNARERLGLYNDLLGATPEKKTLQADHTEARLGVMPQITLVPEDWNEEEGEEEEEEAAPVPAPPPPLPEARTAAPAAMPAPEDAPPHREQADPDMPAPEVEAVFRALGFSASPASRAERERIMLQAAELTTAAVDGMLQALRNRADSKNELRLPVTTMSLASDNPLKFSPTGKAALDYLLAPSHEGFLPPAQAMLNGFDDLHSHHMGLIAGARAVAQAILARISPDAVASRLDATGTVRFARTRRLWSAYARLHAALRDDENGFASFFLDDFARAYEMQVRTLNPACMNRQGDLE